MNQNNYICHRCFDYTSKIKQDMQKHLNKKKKCSFAFMVYYNLSDDEVLFRSTYKSFPIYKDIFVSS